MLLPFMLMQMLLLPLPSALTALTSVDHHLSNANRRSSGEQDLEALIAAENARIDTLTAYIDALAKKIIAIKRETESIAAIHASVGTNVDAYLNNPLNAVSILKRFVSNWPELQRMAHATDATAGIVRRSAELLAAPELPSEEDYEAALENLLWLQNVYNLKTDSLALGVVNGVKLGSEMSWSDCLEIGRKSDKNGDYQIAQFWLQTALGKLSPVNVPGDSNDTTIPTTITAHHISKSELQRGRVKILEAQLSASKRAGRPFCFFRRLAKYADALLAVEQLLQVYPNNASLEKVKADIERKMSARSTGTALRKQKRSNNKKNAQKTKKVKHSQTKRAKRNQKQNQKTKQTREPNKSAESLLIAELCRVAATHTGGRQPATHVGHHSGHCMLQHGNLPALLLKPLQLELLSVAPFIALQHNALSTHEIDNLRQLVTSDNDVSVAFTQLGQEQLQCIAQRKLSLHTGHAAALFDKWRVQRVSHELPSIEATDAPFSLRVNDAQIIAHTMLGLHAAKLGGAVVFPQLQLSLELPPKALLYWSNLDEFKEVDYRSVYHVCPVLAGVQITALTSIRFK